ncbi:MAG TPA: TonB-dependent receptor [Terriglobales bacterium]|nr:TonB-dependent receptor [Terriglobales bacterium]
MRRQFLSTLRRYGTTAALTIIALLMLQSAVFAQHTGVITGTVLDSTGAVVPGAKVELINQATQDTRNTVSNGEGYFTFAGVMPGTYTVKADAQGFKTWIVKGVGVLPGDKKNVSATLAVGTTDTSVTVESTLSAVQVVDSGERSAVLTAQDVKNLALVGRDITELTKVLPGFNNFTGNGGLNNKSGYDATVVGIGSSVGNGYSANGTPDRGGTDLISDGAHVIDPGCNCNATQTINADMVAEVKVQTSNFGADSAKGPVVIHAVGKSGSSNYHGEAYMHLRHSKLNAADWQTNYNKLEKPKDRYYYPGGQFGGPVRLPWSDFNKNKDKMFFFSAFEYYNQRFPEREGIMRAVVPTVGMRSGNFGPTGEGNADLCSVGGWLPQCGLDGHYTDGSAIPAGTTVLPQQYMDPGGLAIMKMIPLPNADPTKNGGINFIAPQIKTQNGWMMRHRVDYNFSDATKLYVSYNLQKQTSDIPVMLWWQPPQSVPFPGGAGEKGTSNTLSGNLLHVFGPTLTNELTVTVSRYTNPGVYDNMAAVSRKNLGYPYQGVFKNGVDVMPALSNGWWIPGYPMIYQPDTSSYESTKFMPTISDNLTKVFGRHTFKTGLYWEITGNKQGTVDYQNGRLQFAPMGWSNIASGNPVANLLMGVASNYYEINRNATTDMNYKSLSFYFQDSWKATNRLTLDLGLRFEHSPSWTDATGNTGLATFTKEQYMADVAAGKSLPGLRWNAIDKNVPLSGRDVKPLFVSPRVGLAYDIFGNGNTLLRGGWGAYRWRDQYNDYAGALSTALGTRTYETWSPTRLSDLNAMTVTGAASSTIYAVDPKDDTQPVTYTYNLTLSQKTPHDTLLEIAYVGNNSENLMLHNSLGDINNIPLGAYFGPSPVTGIVLAPNRTVEEIKNIDETESLRRQFRPYTAYEHINMYKHGGYSNYNALQVSWVKPRGSFTYGLNYTFSKALGIQGDADPYKLRANYGVLNTDRTHVFNGTVSYEVGNVIKSNPVLGVIVNGWMISNITSIQSGANLQSAYDKGFRASGPSGVSGLNFEVKERFFLGTPDYTLIPTLTCDPSEALGPNQAIQGCFALPQQGGQNGPINMPYMRGPGYFNSDIAVQKTFKVTEGQNIQFRMSAFNFLNHPLWTFNNDIDGNIRATFDQNKNFAPARVPYGIPYLKNGRRVLEFTLRYSF